MEKTFEMEVTRVARTHATFKDDKQTKPSFIEVELEDLESVERDRYYSEAHTHLGYRLKADDVPPQLGQKVTVKLLF